MRTDAHTALGQAFAFLEEAVGEVRSSGGSRLAPVDALARRAGVSRGTMLKAVRALVHKGTLFSRRGSGLFAAPPGPRPKQSAAGELRHEAAARALARSLEQGEFVRGEPLPPAKVLANRYGVSVPTFRRAIRLLARTGELRVERRRYVPICHAGASGRASILFAVPGLPNQVVSPRNDLHEADLAAVEDVCSRAGIVAQRVNCHYVANPQRMVTTPSLSRCAQPDVLGTCLGIAVVPRGLNAQVLGELVEFATGNGLPIAVLADMDPPEGLAPYHDQPLLRVVQPGKGPECGEEIGRMLAGLGHRHVMYVQPAVEQEWSGRRLRGLRSGLSLLGEESTVTVAGVESMPQCTRTSTESAADTATESLFAVIGPPGPRHAETRVSMQRVFTMAAEGAWLREQVDALLGDWGRKPPVTALVGANDPIALACLDALGARGVRVPHDVSVAGFDDLPEAARCGLTSYNFDSRACAQAMLNHLLRPPRGPQARQAKAVVRVPGRVSVRLTTGPARRA